MSRLSRFREKATRVIELPSGLDMVVRPPHAWDFVEVGEIPLPLNGSADSEPIPSSRVVTGSRTMDYIEHAMVCCVIDPPLCRERDVHGKMRATEGALHIDELETSDYISLSRQLMGLAGLLEEDAKAVESFREDTLSEADTSVGAGVPLSAV